MSSTINVQTTTDWSLVKNNLRIHSLLQTVCRTHTTRSRYLHTKDMSESERSYVQVCCPNNLRRGNCLKREKKGDQILTVLSPDIFSVFVNWAKCHQPQTPYCCVTLAISKERTRKHDMVQVHHSKQHCAFLDELLVLSLINHEQAHYLSILRT